MGNRYPYRYIVTQTPLRISFAGGGTDFPDFYSRESGAVFSTSIDKFIYVTVKEHNELFMEKFRLNYSETEHCNSLEDIKNAIARECLRLVPVDSSIYVSTVADLPAFSGLGSSSSFSVGLLNALHAFRGESVTPGQLAEEASHIEINVLKRPIGKQDQYAAAFGGLNYFVFQTDGRVTLEPQTVAPHEMNRLFSYLMLFWTNITRDAASILKEQKQNTFDNLELLVQLKHQANALRSGFLSDSGCSPEVVGRILDNSWQFKKKLATSISNEHIDQWYDRAKFAGALGGKLCGAGGGGFLCFIVPPERQQQVRTALHDLNEVSIKYEPIGSRIIVKH